MADPDRNFYGPLRVLIIEDQVYVRRVIMEILRAPLRIGELPEDIV